MPKKALKGGKRPLHGSGAASARAGKKATSPKRGPSARGRQKPGRTAAVTVAAVTREPDAGADAAASVVVTLRTQAGTVATVRAGETLKRAAMQWSYVLSNRKRWNTSNETREEQSGRAQTQLNDLGVTKEHLRRIADFEVVEVSIPYTSEADGWEARIFPWEYMLSAATRPFRKEEAHLTVTRHLDRQGGGAPAKPPASPRLLMVESAPADLRQQYTFTAERNIVRCGLGFSDDAAGAGGPRDEISLDETRKELQDRILRYAPHIIHVAGFDNNQAAALGVLKTKQVHDGYLLKGDPEGVEAVAAADIAKTLNAAKRKPSFIAFNIYYSAARTCAMAVAEGAGASIGFQDEFDDALTELFFTNFYDAWRRLNWDLLQAFKFSCDLLRQQPQGLVGTGIVLWSAESLIKAASADAEKITTSLASEKEKVITPDDLPGGDIRSILSVEVKTSPNLNYSMLHNNCELFEKFTLRKEKPGRVKDIRVDVVLYAGAESARYSCSLDMVDSPLDLNRFVRVPLLYSVDFLNNENIHTGLFVEVSWREQLLHRQTYRVTLPPLDEWRGNDAERVWLPSFILPRDPAVSKLVDLAQRYVMALRDDSGAGFDGYQCIRPDDPESVAGVDQQVRALWSALIYDHSISYINPPPTYNLTAQRLRTPSEVVEGRRGTCIDLALLLAACLEYVDIYPVIFLFKNHALPGYWRGSNFQNDFKSVAASFQSTVTPAGKEKADISTVQRWPWYHGKNAYEEIMDEVMGGRLYPIETVGITRRDSYKDSAAEGIAKLLNENKLEAFEFEAMIDVIQARDSLITPIPRR